MAKRLPIWVEIELPVTKAEARAALGKPCAVFHSYCMVCQQWRRFKRDGTITFCAARRRVMQLLKED